MSRRRGARGSRSLAELLDAQPASLRRLAVYMSLEAELGRNAALRRVRLPPRAVKLLLEPRLAEGAVRNFCETYRLPSEAFVRGLLGLRKERRSQLAELRSRRESAIDAFMAGAPPPLVAAIEYLGAAEASRNASRPVWSKRIRPSSKKRARELAAGGALAWRPVVSGWVAELRASYRGIPLPPLELVLACAEIGAMPDPASGELPIVSAIKAAFRRASHSLHPDAGGAGEAFMRAQASRDRLILESEARSRALDALARARRSGR